MTSSQLFFMVADMVDDAQVSEVVDDAHVVDVCGL
jgi:hypothetical protein